MSKKGTVRKLLETYGFVTGSEGEDLFFHQSAVTSGEFRNLAVGQEVTYDVERDRKTNRDRAVNVQPVSAAQTAPEQ